MEKGYAIFQIPTKEAKLFAGIKKQIVSDIYPVYDNDLKKLLESFQQNSYYDENISHYTVLSIKN